MRKTILLSGLILLAVLIPVFLVCAATYNVDPYSDNMLYEHSVFGINSVRILEDAVIHSGSVGIAGSPSELVEAEPLLDYRSFHDCRNDLYGRGDGNDLHIDRDVYFENDTSIFGHTVLIDRGASAFNVYADTLYNEGEIRGAAGFLSDQVYAVYMPDVPEPQPGVERVSVRWGERRYLPPGSYGQVSVRAGGTLVLSGGRYDMQDLELGYYRSSLEIQGQVDIVIKGRLLSYIKTYIGPEKGSGIEARDIAIYVLGEDGDYGFLRGFPKAAHLGTYSEIHANVYVPNGSLWVLRSSIAKGAFVAKDVLIGCDVEVSLDTRRPKGLGTDFEDPNLEAAVREALGLPDGPLFIEDLEQLYTLSAGGREIKSLHGLESCLNLMSLVLDHNEISDLSPLSMLTNLEFLNLNDNAISDTAPLAGLINLSCLYLGGNELYDEGVAHLKGLINLNFLSLERNHLCDLSFLYDLTDLTSLVLSNNEIFDLTPLQGLVNLTGLELYNNFITVIDPLAGLTNLGVLYLDSNSITSISALTNLTQLHTLALDNNSISDIEPLGGLVNLEVLYLNENGVSDLTYLADLTNLRVLFMDANAVSDISDLSGLENLTALYMARNKITDISALSNLLQLSVIFLSDNLISNITALKTNCDAGGLSAGDMVYLYGNPLDGETFTDDVAYLTGKGVFVYTNLYGTDSLY